MVFGHIGTPVFGSHGHASHADRMLDNWIPADRFQQVTGATFGLTLGIPRYRFANAADQEVAALLEIPPRAVRIGGAQPQVGAKCLFLEPAGVVGAGNARCAFAFSQFKDAQTIIGSISANSFQSLAIPVEGANVVVREVVVPVVATSGWDIASRLYQLNFRRNATDALDTFEDLLDLMGILVQIVEDE